jgi:preprotein translocase subunit SecA
MGGDKIQSIAKMLLPTKEIGIFELTQSQFSDAIARAQRQMEAWHFSGRKHLFEYDSVVDIQRKAIYKKRDSLIYALENIDPDKIDGFFIEHIESHIDPLVDHLIALSYAQNQNLDNLPAIVLSQIGIELPVTATWNRDSLFLWIQKHVVSISLQLDIHHKLDFLRHVSIRAIDRLWIDHIDQMQQLREKV